MVSPLKLCSSTQNHRLTNGKLYDGEVCDNYLSFEVQR